MLYYQCRKDDIKVIAELSQLVKEVPTSDFDEYYFKIQRLGLISNRE